MLARVSDLASGKGGLVFTPPLGNHSATVILMHGLGDSAEGLRDLPEMWNKDHSHIKFVLPTANMRAVTLNMGHQMNAWYDIQALDDRTEDPCIGLDESCEYIRGLLEHEHLTTGLPYSRMMLAGFSQGGAVSLFTGLQNSVPLSGLLVLSGYLPKAHGFELAEHCKDVPILHCHGAADPVVRPDWATKSQKRLLEKGVAQYDLRMYPGVGHSLSMEIINAASAFFAQHLSHDPEYVVKPRHPRFLSVKELREAIRTNGLGHKAVGFSEKSEFVNLLESFYEEKSIATREE